jgi:hypothetical protein
VQLPPTDDEDRGGARTEDTSVSHRGLDITGRDPALLHANGRVVRDFRKTGRGHLAESPWSTQATGITETLFQ